MLKREKIERLKDSLDFDLGFSDYYKDKNVRHFTFEKKFNIMKQANVFITIEESMNFSIFSSKVSNHPTAEIYTGLMTTPFGLG
jgi:hypothetical protein